MRRRRGGDPRHSRARPAADPRRRHRLLLPRADARPVSRAWRRRAAARAAESHRGRRGPDVAAPLAAAGGSAHRRARIMPRDLKRLVRALEVYYTTGRPLTSHFAQTDVSDRRIARCCRSHCDCPPRHRRTRRAARRRAVRARASSTRAAVLLARGVSPERTTVRRPRLSTGDGDAARRARRGGNACTHRPGEPAIRASAVDLVPKRA